MSEAVAISDFATSNEEAKPEPSQVRLLVLPVDSLTIGHDFRLDDDPEQQAELAASVAQLGVLQPLVVRQAGDGWEVVAGRRRLAAARSAGLESVPCVVRDLDDAGAEDIALAENVHRRRLSPIEEGLAYARMRDRGLTQRAIAKRAGRSTATVSILLQLLTLPEPIQARVHAGDLSYYRAYEHWKRFGTDRDQRSGGHNRGVPGGGNMDAVATHWRRRHDRLLAGLHAVVRSKDAGHYPLVVDMLRKLIKLDTAPLDDIPVEKDWRAT